jgi:hypothetical protein
MSSYLTTLAARALDHPQPIRPRLPSLFEPATGPHVNFREVTVNKHSRPPRTSTRVVESDSAPQKSPPIVSSLSSPHEVRLAETIAQQVDVRPHSVKSFSQSMEPSTEQPRLLNESGNRLSKPRTLKVENKSLKEREKADAKPSLAPESIKPTIQVAQAITIERTNVVGRAADASPQPPARETKSEESQPASPQSIVVKPEVTTNIAEPIFVEPELLAPDPAPSVKITIGRVDVTAIMPPTPTPVAAAREPATKALSLEQYLKQRNGDQR